MPAVLSESSVQGFDMIPAGLWIRKDLLASPSGHLHGSRGHELCPSSSRVDRRSRKRHARLGGLRLRASFFQHVPSEVPLVLLKDSNTKLEEVQSLAVSTASAGPDTEQGSPFSISGFFVSACHLLKTPQGPGAASWFVGVQHARTFKGSELALAEAADHLIAR